MAQEVQTLTLCDPCLVNDGVRVDAVHHSITYTVGNGRAVTVDVDLCEQHGTPLMVVLDMVAETGRTTRATGRPKAVDSVLGDAVTATLTPDQLAALTCPAGQCGHVAKTRSALQAHTRGQHDRTLGELLGRAEFGCPAEGCERAFDTRQGLRMHTTRAHSDMELAAV